MPGWGRSMWYGRWTLGGGVPVPRVRCPRLSGVGVCRGWVVGCVVGAASSSVDASAAASSSSIDASQIACSAADRRGLTNIGVVSQPRPGKLPKNFEVGALKRR
eukprot:2172658-Prymnesium_polylepis.2